MCCVRMKCALLKGVIFYSWESFHLELAVVLNLELKPRVRKKVVLTYADYRGSKHRTVLVEKLFDLMTFSRGLFLDNRNGLARYTRTSSSEKLMFAKQCCERNERPCVSAFSRRPREIVVWLLVVRIGWPLSS